MMPFTHPLGTQRSCLCCRSLSGLEATWSLSEGSLSTESCQLPWPSLRDPGLGLTASSVSEPSSLARLPFRERHLPFPGAGALTVGQIPLQYQHSIHLWSCAGSRTHVRLAPPARGNRCASVRTRAFLPCSLHGRMGPGIPGCREEA